MAFCRRILIWLAVFLVILALVGAEDTLLSSGFQSCANGVQDVTVSRFELSFHRETNQLVFSVAGNSLYSQNVTGKPHIKSTV